jgi:hypothetical protein
MDKDQVKEQDQIKEQKKEQEQNQVKDQVIEIKKINHNNIVRKQPPWISPTPTMSTSCYKLTMDMVDKQPPKKIQVYKKIKINKLHPI